MCVWNYKDGIRAYSGEPREGSAIMEVIIMRGIPGSGKSTWINNNLPAKGTKVVSADHYWIQEDGSYQFEMSKIGEAHSRCMRKFIDAIHHNNILSLGHLVVDNTNVNQWELSPYVAVANAFKIPVRIVEIRCDLDKAFARNIHDVPKITTEGMAASLAKRLSYQFTRLVKVVEA